MTGSGTLADPYVIWDINDLQSLRTRDAAYYKLGADIDASATIGWFGGMGFEPVNWPFPQRRFPTGDFSSTGAWTVFPAVPATKFDKVNEIDPDGDTNYIRYGGGVATVLFTSPNFNIPLGSTISNIQAWCVRRDEGGGGTNTWWGYIRVGGVDYQSPWTMLGGTGPIYHIDYAGREFTTNPATGLPWTAEDINGVGPNPLQAWGFKVSGTRVWRFTEIYILVKLNDCPVQYIFDGNGHKITNLFIDRRADTIYIYGGYNIGLFHQTLSSHIKGLTLENIDVKGDGNVGSIIGFVRGSNFNMDNCHVSGNVLGNGTDVGGLIADSYLYQASIRNCSFNGQVHGNYRVGGLVGCFWNESIAHTIIRDCEFNGQLIIDSSFFGNAGGIAGYAGKIDVISCTVDGIINGGNSSGGMVGTADTCSFEDSKVYAAVIADPARGNYFGGLAGNALGSFRILRCEVTGPVSSPSGFCVGGLVGYADVGNIEQSFSSGAVLGDDRVGGLVGFNDAGILNCYATGDITSNTDVAGGLIGRQDGLLDIKNSYSIGLVQGGPVLGGLIAENVGGGAIVNCFWNIETSGQTTSAGGMGKTTEEMNHLPIFTAAGWDFTSLWNISRVSTVKAGSITAGSAVLDGLLDLTIINEAYPFLRWQTVVELPCDCGFEWGETAAFGNFTPVDSKNTGEAFAKALAGLEPNTAYYFRARASSSPGPIHGGTGTFTTLVGIEVETLPATNITENSARIWGRVRKVPITAMARFDWGGNIEYGAQTPWAQGLVSDDMFYYDLTNLAEGRAYHFRAVAMGSTLVYGNDMTFTTRSPVGPVVLIQEELAHLMEVS